MLDYLVREDFVTPSGSLVRGRGKPRVFTFGDLVTLKVIARLLSSGIEIRRLAKGLRSLRDSLGGATALSDKSRYLLSDGTDIFLVEHGNLESLTSNRQLAFAFLIDLATCEMEISTAHDVMVRQVG